MHNAHTDPKIRSPDHLSITGITQDLSLSKIEEFTELYELHQESIFRYCLFKCRDRDVGMDLMQETFKRYWLFLESREKILHARGFLYKIAYNLFVDHVRKKKTVSLDQLVEDGFQPCSDPWQKTCNRMDTKLSMKTLHKVRNPYKEVLHQRFIMGLAPAEIAKMSGVTPNVISVRIDRGLKHLRAYMEPA